jgi:hypothetical protein
VRTLPPFRLPLGYANINPVCVFTNHARNGIGAGGGNACDQKRWSQAPEPSNARVWTRPTKAYELAKPTARIVVKAAWAASSHRERLRHTAGSSTSAIPPPTNALGYESQGATSATAASAQISLLARGRGDDSHFVARPCRRQATRMSSAYGLSSPE